MSKLIAAESVTIGHPDLVADSISDAILQANYEKDQDAHVACETLVTTNRVILAGEIKSKAELSSEDVEKVVREAIRKIGYKDGEVEGFDADTVEITNLLHEQSADIDMGVTKENEEESGAGDQGFMIGYASHETVDYLPLPIAVARALTNKLTEVREAGLSKYLLPDGKSQVVLDCEGDRAELKSVLISNHHKDVDMELVKEEIISLVIKPVINSYLGPEALDTAEILINPTGRFVIGGPNGDTGLTGRKLAVENYGPSAPIGGGASAGKDLSKVDRSAAYAARYVAKNLVAAGLAEKCQVQLSYAIGVAEPTSISVTSFGTGKYADERLAEIVREHFDLRPFAIRKWINEAGVDFNEVRKIGAYGNDKFPWEQLDKLDELANF